MRKHLIPLLILLLLPTLAFAQSNYLVGIPGLEDTDIDFNKYINAVYAMFIGIAALLAVVKIIIAGVKYMFSDIVTQKSEAKKDIKGALLGLVIVLAAVLILTVINDDLAEFNFEVDRLPEVGADGDEGARGPGGGDATLVSAACDNGGGCVVESCNNLSINTKDAMIAGAAVGLAIPGASVVTGGVAGAVASITTDESQCAAVCAWNGGRTTKFNGVLSCHTPRDAAAYRIASIAEQVDRAPEELKLQPGESKNGTETNPVIAQASCEQVGGEFGQVTGNSSAETTYTCTSPTRVSNTELATVLQSNSAASGLNSEDQVSLINQYELLSNNSSVTDEDIVAAVRDSSELTPYMNNVVGAERFNTQMQTIAQQQNITEPLWDKPAEELTTAEKETLFRLQSETMVAIIREDSLFIQKLGVPRSTPHETRMAVCNAAGYQLIPIPKKDGDRREVSDQACLPTS